MVDISEIKKETRMWSNEGILTTLSGLRKIGNLTKEEIAYNNALGDVYDHIIETEGYNLLENTVKSGKWVRDQDTNKTNSISFGKPAKDNKHLSDGQIIIYSAMVNLTREREECVEIPTLLDELKNRYNDYSEEERNALERALLGK